MVDFKDVNEEYNPLEKEIAPNCHKPNLLKENFEEMMANICADIKRCMPVYKAFIKNGVSRRTYNTWKKHYNEELELYEGSELTTWLIILFKEVEKAEGANEGLLSGTLFEKAIGEGDVESCKYLLERRYGWNKKKSVEVSSPEDRELKINLVTMTDKHAKKE